MFSFRNFWQFSFLLCSLTLGAQTPERMVGTVASISSDRSSVDIKSDDGKQTSFHLTAETVLQRIAPGEKTLKNAQPIQAADVNTGDRVLVNADAATGNAKRLIVMGASDIAKRDEADRAAWTAHGIAGIVAAKKADGITLRGRDVSTEVEITSATRFRRYAPGSVQFADAKSSALAEVQPGDQLRARGEKSADGLKVTADEVVFGTFITKAGTVTAVDADAKTIRLSELNTSKPLLVKISADSKLKKMPDFGGGGMGGAGMSGPGGARPSGAGPAAAGSGPPFGGRPPDIGQMIERLPSANLNEIKAGDTVVFSSTRTDTPNEFSAIILLDNAGMLVRMASARRDGAGSSGPGRQGMGEGAGIGMQGGLGGLDLNGLAQ